MSENRDKVKEIKKVTGSQKKSNSVVKRGGSRLTGIAGLAVGRVPTRSITRSGIATVRKKEKTPFPVSFVLTVAVMTVLVLYTIINYAEINTFKNEISQLKTEMSELRKTETRLQNQLNFRYSEADIENVAANELGMVKSSELERKYVDLTNDDKTEIVRREEKGFGLLLSSIGEAIRDLFD